MDGVEASAPWTTQQLTTTTHDYRTTGGTEAVFVDARQGRIPPGTGDKLGVLGE
ncbi:hypothetical protein AA0113_g3237 [Alternaria arborescens]|uniref:Uncharacterized protein n=1 Tax=Alternaria arborescens TaxID=156630 RepID=A0A4Q4SI43_9PLEO|nr:hypothetical protein AA0111_g2162 [Alternaria arborescens]RYO37495.1 hypothetical protein AA0111_g2162 [Alternaria arborescens]RYO70307.1 hypothetical protein AA0113_g3237 [Alternaria arborescens]